MASNSSGTDDAPGARTDSRPPAPLEHGLTLVDADGDDAPDGLELADELPFGAVVAFDGSGPDAWIAVGRECCIGLPDTR